MRWPRRERPPADVVEQVGRDERIVAWADTADGPVVATVRTLRLPGADPLPWHLIAHVVWQQPDLTITPAAETPGDDDTYRLLEQLPPRVVRLTEPRSLPAEVRNRVTGSVRHSSRHALQPSGSALVVGRRVAGRDGLTWYVELTAADRTDPLVREQVSHLVTAARGT